MDALAVLPESVVSGRRKPLHATLAARLKAARLAAGMDRAPLSAAAGLSHGVVASIEVQGRIPSIDTVEKIARALQLSPCFLAYGVEGALLPPLGPDEALRAAGAGGRLQQLRDHQALSLRGLAEAAQLSATAVMNLEARKVLPSVATAEALAVALGCSPCWLAYAEGPDPIADPQGAAAELQAVKFRPPRSPRKPPAQRRRRVRSS